MIKKKKKNSSQPADLGDFINNMSIFLYPTNLAFNCKMHLFKAILGRPIGNIMEHVVSLLTAPWCC